jgi:hypothetical protein
MRHKVVGSPMEDEFRIRKLEALVGNLERQVKFLLKINSLDLSALREAPDTELLKYYQDAVTLLGLRKEKLEPEVMSVWGELFIQLSEFEIVRLQEMVEYEHTWEPFYTLCVRMMTVVRQRRNFTKDITLRNLYALLDRGRKNLRDSAMIMIQKYPQNLSQTAKALLKDDSLII